MDRPDIADDEEDPHSGASPEEIEECLKLLDEVWPPDDALLEDIPRELGRFRILSELGRGGFGVVFLAEDSLLGRRVAVKVPRVEVLTSSESWRRFLREAKAACRLDHQNLVPLLEAGAVGPVGYIVSAYVPGPSLERWLGHRREPVPPRWAARLVADLARAVEHVHGQNILHRDLKPGNVLLHAPGRDLDPRDPASWEGVAAEEWMPRICDFGLAKLHEIEEEETRSRVVCGSPPYMAPEQADSRRDEIGPATDVYGLGTILYELLTGRPPFGGKSNLETLQRVVSEEPVPPRRRRPGIARDLDTICLKCLAKRPERRYASAAELADDLGRFLDGRPVAARPTPAWERAGRWARRHPTAAALALALMLAAFAGVCGLLWHAAVLREKNEELRSVALRAEGHARDADAQRRVAIRQRSGSQLFQAHLAVSSARLEQARRLLDVTAAEFGSPGAATFPWRYIEASVRDHIEVFTGHRGMVDCLAISADGRSLASGDDRGEIRVWEVDGGRCRLALSGPHRAIGRLAWSADGAKLASAGRESGEVRVWEAASGRCLGRLEGTGVGEPIWDLSFEPDGYGIRATGPRHDPGAAATRRWDLTRLADPFPETPLGPGPAAPAPRSDDRLRSLIDLLDDGGSPATPSGPVGARISEGSRLPEVAFTRDRALGIMAVGDGTFEVLRNGSWTRLATIHLRHPHNVVVLIDPKDSREASPPAEKTRLRRLAKRLVPDFRQNPSSPGPLSQGYDSWSSTSGPVGGELVLWIERHKRLSLIALDRGEERRVVELGPLTGVQSTALGPDGATLAAGTEDHRVRVWHRRPSQRVISIEGHSPNEAWAVAFAPDGHTIASGGDDHLIRLWDPTTGREKGVLRGHHALVTSLAFSPDSPSLASGSYDDGNLAMIWDLESWAPRSRLRGHRRRVRRMVFSRDGRILASAGDDDFILLWDPRDGRRIATIAVGHTPGPGHLAFHRDGGTIAATGGGHRFDLVDVATGRVRWIPMDEEVGPLVFSLDGSQLMIGMRDGSIRTWDMGENRQIRKVQGHAGLVLGLALSPDGVVLASAGEDGTVRVWDVATGQELLCLTDCRARVNSVAFSRDGLSLAAADHSGAVTIWDAHPRH